MTNDMRAQLDRLRLRTQADVQRLWELLMGPLGFASTRVWICFADDRGAPIPHVVQVGDDGDQRVPGPQEVTALVDCLVHLAAEDDGIASFAVLLSRPGRHGLTDADRQFASGLLAGCREAGVECHPVHVADDRAVMAVAPDDLAAA